MQNREEVRGIAGKEKTAPVVKISIYGPEERGERIYERALKALRRLREETGAEYKIHRIRKEETR